MRNIKIGLFGIAFHQVARERYTALGVNTDIVLKQGMPVGESWLAEVKACEKKVLTNRN